MRKAALLAIAIMIMSLLALGCAQKKVVSETETQPEQVSPPAEQVTPGSTEGEMAIESEEVAPTETASHLDLEAAGLSDIYFDFDSYAIKDQYKDKLMTLANKLLDSSSSVLVEGHCDDRGTDEYNLALGDRRARAVKDFLKAAGVPNQRIETVSFGEERPVCSDQTESCWSQNRRAHFTAEGGM
jgi:peptidoglycan-associated lipoprotein